MGLTYENGQRISKEDQKLIVQMLRQSLNAQLERIDWYIENNEEDAEAFCEPIIKEYRDALEGLEKTCAKAFESGQDIKAADFMTSFFDNIADKAASKIDKDHNQYDGFIMYVANGFGNMVYGRLKYPDMPDNEQDSEDAYKRSTGNFMLAESAMEGIGDIPEYDPNSESIKALNAARSANSSSLAHGLEELEAKRQEILNDEDMSQELKDRNIERINKAEEEYKRNFFGLNTAAEMSRAHSAGLRNRETVTMSDLFTVLSDLNGANRPGDPRGGMLRGRYVQAGEGENAIIGTTASSVPPMLFRALEDISGYMNVIKQTPDPALRKTRALQLAAFSFSTLLSGHFFDDGNGRTCRMFADTILQTFGLPPHTPMPEMIAGKVKTMGRGSDYRELSGIFLEGIKKSSETLEGIRAGAEEKRRQKEADARQKEKTAEDIAARNKKLTNPIRALVKEARDTVSRFESEALVNNKMPSAALNDLMDAVTVFDTGLPLDQLEDAYRNLISKADRYMYSPKTDIAYEDKIRWAASLKAQAMDGLSALQTAFEFNDFTPEEQKLPATTTFFSSDSREIKKNDRALDREKDLPAAKQPENYQIPEDHPDRIVSPDEIIEYYKKRCDQAKDMKEKLALLADLNCASNFCLARPGYSDSVISSIEKYIMLDENGNLRPEAANIGQEIGEVIAGWRLSAYREMVRTGSSDPKWQTDLMRAEALISAFLYPESFGQQYGVDITGYTSVMTEYINSNSTEAEREDMRTRGLSDSSDISGQRRYALEEAYYEELRNRLPGFTADDDYIGSLARIKDGINQSVSSSSYRGSEDIESITGSIDTLMNTAALRTAHNSQLILSNLSARTSSRILNFMERQALDPAWYERTNEVRKSLLEALKFTSPDNAERYLTKENLLRERADEIGRSRELLADFFDRESSASKDTLKKLIAANGDNKTETLAKMGAVIEKRYGLGKEFSVELAKSVKDAIDKVKAAGEDPVSAWENTAGIMKEAMQSVPPLLMNGFEVSRRGDTVKASYMPKLQDEKLKFLANTGHCSKGLFSLLTDPESLDRMKEIFDTKKNYRLFNWNSSEYNNARDALEKFTKERNELLRIAGSHDGRKLTPEEQKDLNDRLDRANERMEQCVITLDTYIRKEGMEDITLKSQDAGFSRIVGAKGLMDVFVKADKDLAGRIAADIRQSVKQDKVKIRNYSELYQEEFRKAEKEGTKDRHRKAAKDAKKQLDKPVM